MKIIDKIESRKNECRHCYGNVNHYEGIWSVFFEEFYKSQPEPRAFLSILDHTSPNKYWYITQPYATLYEPSCPYENMNQLIEYSITRGVDCVVIKDGYHYRGTSCYIFYPFDFQKFKDVINRGLDKHTRYDAFINIGAPHYMRFDKSYVRRLVRNYNLPEESKIIKSAIDFLTWSDIK